MFNCHKTFNSFSFHIAAADSLKYTWFGNGAWQIVKTQMKCHPRGISPGSAMFAQIGAILSIVGSIQKFVWKIVISSSVK